MRLPWMTARKIRERRPWLAVESDAVGAWYGRILMNSRGGYQGTV